MDSELKKDLEMKDLILLGLGNIVGAGIFILLSKMIHFGGKKTIWSVIIISIISFVMALCYLEIHLRYKSNIGEYLAIKNNLGQYFGNLSLYVIYFFAILTVVTITVALSKYLIKYGIFLGFGIKDTQFYHIIVSILFITIMSLINYYGITLSKIFFNSIGIILLVLLGFIIFLALPYFNLKKISNGPKISYHFFVLATILCLFLYNGYDILIKVSDEMKNKEDIKKSMIITVSITSIIYLLIILLGLSVLGYKNASETYHIITNMYDKLTNPHISFITYLVGFLIMFNTAFITLLGSTRFLYGCGRDNEVILSDVWKQLSLYKTPIYTILASYILCILCVLWNNEVLFAVFTNFSCMLLLNLVCISIIIMRYKERKESDEYRLENNYIHGNIENIPIIVVITSIVLFYLKYKIIKNRFYLTDLMKYNH